MVILATDFAGADTPSKVESFALRVGTNAGGEYQQDACALRKKMQSVCPTS